MTTEEITNQVTYAYNGIAEQYQDAYAETDDYDLKYVEKFCSLIRGNRVVDLGCGTGTVAAYLTRKGFDTLGIDDADKMLGIATKNHPLCCFKRFNILHLPSNLGLFHGVVLSYVINHFSNDMLKRLKDVVDNLLTGDGVIYIAAHIGNEEKVVPDPLDSSIQLYYHFLAIEDLDSLFKNYDREFIEVRASFGEEEFLCDKMFVAYRRKVC